VTHEQILGMLPEHKYDGAFLSHETQAHWLLAIFSAAAFMALALFMFPAGHAKVPHLLLTGLFTGTLGILLLLCVQWIAFNTQGINAPRANIVTLLFYIVKFIGFSYRSASTPTATSFSARSLHLRRRIVRRDLQGPPADLPCPPARRPGHLANGVLMGADERRGIRVSEGISYSGNYYNGISGGGIYLVRFVSCVALHAIWSASVAMTLYRRQGDLDGTGGLPRMAPQNGADRRHPDVLHGLYDTCLKQEHGVAALGVAIASFGWLTWQLEWANRNSDEDEGGRSPRTHENTCRC